MEIKISQAELQQRKLFVGMPCYGGMMHGLTARSMIELGKICQQHGIQCQFHFLFNESLVTRARNYIVDEFIRSDNTHMMFIDADIGFNPNDIIAMLALMTDESPYDVLCGPYPKKVISWEKTKAAVDAGLADENPFVLEQYTGDFVFNPLNTGNIKLDEPAEVLEAGTGFMMIHRRAFDLYHTMFKDQIMYLPDHARSANFAGDREIGMYFQAEIDPVSKRYLSEDYLFCQNLRKAGGHIWLCGWMQLQHSGTYTWNSSLMHLAQLGASATVDPALLPHNKKK